MIPFVIIVVLLLAASAALAAGLAGLGRVFGMRSEGVIRKAIIVVLLLDASAALATGLVGHSTLGEVWSVRWYHLTDTLSVGRGYGGWFLEIWIFGWSVWMPYPVWFALFATYPAIVFIRGRPVTQRRLKRLRHLLHLLYVLAPTTILLTVLLLTWTTTRMSIGGWAYVLFYGTCSIGFGTVVCFFLYRDFKRRHLLPGHCRQCAYNLTGNASGVCPECGTSIENESRIRVERENG